MAETVKILNLTLKKVWFDMIASGEKKEEYRELNDYWQVRLEWIDTESAFNLSGFKKFDIVRFRNGYAKNAPTFDIECRGIKVAVGKQKWGARKGIYYYVIKLGNIIKA